MTTTRRLAAILAADVVGYSRLMEKDDVGTLTTLKARRKEQLEPLVAQHKGRIFKLTGDGVLIEFTSAVSAVQCAVDVQVAMATANVGQPDERRITLRVGVHLGDVMVEGSDLYGDGVNIAARLEGIAEPGSVYISEDAHRQVRNKLTHVFDDLGRHALKNVSEPVHVFRVQLANATLSASATPAALPLPDKPSIAVLPFTNMSGDPEQEYFSDGITEDIITELSRFRSLFVIARNSSFSYKGKSVKVQEIGRDLGVAYVVEGSVRRAGNRVRVTAQLIEASTSNHLWAERYDRDLEDIFAVQDEVVRAIAAAVPGQLEEAALDRARRKPSNSLTAYDCYLRGESLLGSSFGSPEAMVMFEKAIEIDPNCARACCRLASFHAYSVFAHGTSVQEALRLAQSFAEKALASDPGDSLVQAIAALAYIMIGDYDLARLHIEKSVASNPNDINVVRAAGVIHSYLGDHAEATAFHDRHLRLDPHFPDSTREMMFDTFYMTRRYDDAILLFRGWRDPPLHLYCELAAAYAQLDRMDQAAAAVVKFKQIKPAGYDFGAVGRAHARMCARREDYDHWIEGYRKAGFEV